MPFKYFTLFLVQGGSNISVKSVHILGGNYGVIGTNSTVDVSNCTFTNNNNSIHILYHNHTSSISYNRFGTVLFVLCIYSQYWHTADNCGTPINVNGAGGIIIRGNRIHNTVSAIAAMIVNIDGDGIVEDNVNTGGRSNHFFNLIFRGSHVVVKRNLVTVFRFFKC